MNVHINQMRIHLHIQHRHRVSIRREIPAIAFLDGGVKTERMDHAAVQEYLHEIPGRSCNSRLNDIAADGVVIIRSLELQ